MTAGLLVCDKFLDEGSQTCRDGFVLCDGFTEPPAATTIKRATATAMSTTTTSSSSTVTMTTETRTSTTGTTKTAVVEVTASTATETSATETLTTTTPFVRVVTAAQGVTVPAGVVGAVTTTKPSGSDASTDPATQKKGVSAGGVVAILGSLLVIGIGVFLFVRLRSNRSGGFDLSTPRMAARLRAASDAAGLMATEPAERKTVSPKKTLQLFGSGGGGDGGGAGEAIGMTELGPGAGRRGPQRDAPNTPPGSRLGKSLATGKAVLLFDGPGGGGGGAIGYGLQRSAAAAGTAPEPSRVLRFDMDVGATADAESSDDEDFGIKMVASRRNPSVMRPVFQLAGPGGGAEIGSATEVRRPTIGSADKPSRVLTLAGGGGGGGGAETSALQAPQTQHVGGESEL